MTRRLYRPSAKGSQSVETAIRICLDSVGRVPKCVFIDAKKNTSFSITAALSYRLIVGYSEYKNFDIFSKSVKSTSILLDVIELKN